MKVNCPFTGIGYKLAALEHVTSVSPHPIFSLPRKQLNMAFSHITRVSPEEKYLLFLAALVGTKLVRFDCPLPFESVSQQLIISCSPEVIGIYNWLQENSQYRDRLPKFVVSKDTISLGLQFQLASFIKDVSNIKRYGVDVLEKKNLKYVGDLAEYAEEKKEHIRALTAAKIQKLANIPVVISWAFRHLELNKYVEDWHVKVLRVLLDSKEKGATYPISVIKEVRGVCLEHLPEEKHDDFLRKSEVVQAIDKILLDRVEVMAALGTAEDRQAAEDTIQDIQRTYTIEVGGQSFLNSANPVATSIRNATSAIGVLEVPTREKLLSEPLPEHYPNRFAYIAAWNRWKQEQVKE